MIPLRLTARNRDTVVEVDISPDNGKENKQYLFDDVTVDCADFRISKNGENVALNPRDFDVLVYLMIRSGRVVEKQELFEQIWKDTFVTDNALTKVIKQIRRALDDSAHNPRYIETVPKRGYRFIADVRTNVKQERSDDPPVRPAESPTGTDVAGIQSFERLHTFRFSNKLAILLAVGCAAVAIGAWLVLRDRVEENQSSQIRSIAVLPLVNESADPGLEYLTDGITEDLIGSCSKIPQLSVKARSSVFRYKGTEADPKTIGTELGVQAVLSGRITQRGSEVILYIELVDTATENVLWQANYSRTMTDLLSLQSEIARDVSLRLKTKLSGIDGERLAKRYTENPDAYQLYLKGRYHWNKRTVLDLQRAIDYLQRALAADPNYALAYAALADAYTLLSEYGGASTLDTNPKARKAASAALSLDDQLAAGHAALALALNNDYDLVGSEREYKRAIELDPADASVHQLYASLLVELSRPDEAFAEDRLALEIDPLSLICNRSYGDNLFYARRYDEAYEQIRKTLELDENFASAYASLFNVARVKGQYAESAQAFARHKELLGDTESAAAIRESFGRGGWKGFLRAMTNEPSSTKISSYLEATFHAELGENDKAMAELSRALEAREYFLVRLNIDPRMDGLRGDKRFQDLTRQVGLAP